MPSAARFLSRFCPAYCLLLLTVAPALTTSLMADTAFLRNGERVTGRITNQTRTEVTFQTAQGLRVVSKSDIQRITYEDPAAARQDEIRKAEEAKKAEELKREETRRAEEARKAQEQKRKREEEKGAQEKRRSKSDERPMKNVGLMGALGRSAVLPGWGQIAQGRTRTGLLLGASAFLLSGMALANQQRYTRAQNEYNFTSSVVLLTTPMALRSVGILRDDQLVPLQFLHGSSSSANSHDAARRARSYYLTALAGLALIYAANLTDVILFRPGSSTLMIELRPGFAAVRISL